MEFYLAGAIEPEGKLGISHQEVMEWHNLGLIKYCGFEENVAKLIDAADCVVLPSYREGTPKSLLEAAAMGKVLVATDVPGCREIVKDEYNGYLCKVKDATDLAAAMEKVTLLTPVDFERMGAASRKLAEEEFSIQKVAAVYRDLL